MKKVLFATTALIATAGVAAADVTVGGYGYVGATFDGATNTTAVSHAVRLTFGATVETDAGVSFGATSRITITDNNDNGQLGHNKITVSSGGLTMAVGATHGAMKTTARIATFHGFNDGGLYYQAGGTGVDNNISSHNDSGNNVLIAYEAGDFRVAASTDVAGTTQELAASYTFNSFTIAAGVDSNSDWMLGAKYNGGNWNVGLGTNDNSDIVLTAGYDISAATSIGLGVDAASGGGINAAGIQVSHDLGGANLVGAVGQVGGNTTVASLGVMFNF